MLPAAEKITLVLEGIGDDRVRVNSSSLDHPLVILPDQALESWRSQKSPSDPGRTSAYWLNHDAVGVAEVGYGRQRNSYSVTL
jgi:hypothetical protein